MADTLIQGTTIIEDKRREFGGVISISPMEFKPASPEVDNVTYDSDGTGKITLVDAGLVAIAGVNLPHGATVTSAIVYSNVTTENWTLLRNPVNESGNSNTLATAALGTKDTTISFEVINNNDFKYHIITDAMDATDTILGCVITYE